MSTGLNASFQRFNGQRDAHQHSRLDASRLAAMEPNATRGTFSPLAYFSSVTIAEHDAVQKQLDLVRRSAAMKAQELDDTIRAHRRQAEVTLADIDRQEHVLRGDYASIVTVIATLKTSVDREFSLDEADAADFAEEKLALQQELESLAALESDLRKLKDTVAVGTSHVSVQKASYVRETERCATEFALAREETARVGNEVSRHLNHSPFRARSPLQAPLPVRPATFSFVTPRPPPTPPLSTDLPKSPNVLASRYVSPTRRGASPPRQRETTASPTRTYAPQSTALNASRTLSPSRAPNQLPTMHQLCSTGQVTEALEVLRQSPDVINELDGDANTPLHAACASPHLSLELVNALLVAGSSTAAKNDDGYTPFHVACLNTADHGTHSLKKLFLFKAGVNPNQRTSRGETAAHLCAKHDKHLESLKYLTGAGVDLHIAALSAVDEADSTKDPKINIGSPKRLTPLETAQRSGVRSRRSAEVIKAALQQ